jgi:hypothetical protein
MEALKHHSRDLEQKLSGCLTQYYKLSANDTSPSSTTTHSSSLRFDPENGITSTADNKELDVKLDKLEVEIQNYFENLNSTAEKMESLIPTTIPNTAFVRSLRDRLVDQMNDFKHMRESIKKRRDLKLLLATSTTGNNQNNEGDGDGMRWLDRERRGIDQASRGVDESIGRAYAIKHALDSQTARLSNVSRTLVKFGEAIPGVNSIIRTTQNKKVRDNVIVGCAVASLTIMMFWWVL